MNFLEAVKSFFVRWNDFKGRSSRSEYWWAILFTNIANIVLNMLSTTLQQSESVITLVLLLLILGLLLFMLVAIFSLIARRLHDINKSGWWYLLVFTIIGMIPLLYWFVQKGDNLNNRFGSNPLAKPQND